MNEEQTLVVHNSSFQNVVWALAYGLVAVALGYIFLTAGEASGRRLLIGLFFMAIMAVPTISHIQAIFDRRPQIVIDEQGIFSTEWARGLIPWAEMESVRLQGTRRLSSKVEVVVKTAEGAPSTKPKLEALVLDLRGKDTNATAVWQFIRTLKGAKRPLRKGMLLPTE